MKTILLTSSESLSGGTRQAVYLARGLADIGQDVSVFAPARADAPGLDPGLDWRELPRERRAWRAAVEAALPRTGPAVVHAFHNKGVKALAWWGLAWQGLIWQGLGRRRDVVCLGHRGVVFRPGNPLPWWSPGLDGLTTNSRACARVLRSLGVSGKRIFVVYNGIPAERVRPARPAQDVRQELGIAPEAFVFGTVAGDKPVKGADVLLAAFAALPQGLRDRSVLVMAGCRPEHWGATAQALGLAGRVRLLGRVEHPADYLQVMDAFVLPSRSESMPNTLLEAFFFGLPVAASAVGGVPELLEGAGLAVRPGRAKDLAGAMERLALDAALRGRLGQGARALSTRFTVAAKLAAMQKVYAELLARRGLAEAR